MACQTNSHTRVCSSGCLLTRLQTAPAVQISADYSVDRLTLKSAVALAAAPTLDVAVTTGVDKLTLGADVQVDLQKAAPSKVWRDVVKFGAHFMTIWGRRGWRSVPWVGVVRGPAAGRLAPKSMALQAHLAGGN